jgi:hypothetical protein
MISHRSIRRGLAAATIAASGACSDSIPTAPGASAWNAQSAFASEGRGTFHRYYAIGTSVSMGWASNGVVAASQRESWPAQLARMAHREMTLPLISGTGCQSPLKAPLATGRRLSNEPAAAPAGTLSCAPLEDGVTLPTQNLAIAAALTRDALFTTPETVTDLSYIQTYSRILPPGHSQITALEASDPKFVSVELGANEVLGASNGIAVPGITLFPVSIWAPLYTQLVNRVQAVTKEGLLVGLVEDVADFPAFRRGSELWAERFAFQAAFNVSVATDCENSDNLLFVPVRVPTAVATGIAMRNAGAGAFTLSCAGAGPTVADYVITPAEAAAINTQLAQMNAHIRNEATRLGFAYAELEALYGRADLKSPFNVVQLMTSMQPYGQLVSLDGVHPTGEGQRIIAEAAAAAIDARYGYGITTTMIASVDR